MNPITQDRVASARTPGPGRQAAQPAHHPWLHLRGRPRAASAGAGLLGAAAIAAVLLASSLPASATQAPQSARPAAGLTAAGSADDGRLEATFTDSAGPVTHGQGMVELILTGTGTVQGFGAPPTSSEWSRTSRPPRAAPEAPPTVRRHASSCPAACSNCTRPQ